MSELVYSPSPRLGTVRSATPVKPSGRNIEHQGASYSAALILQTVIECVIDLCLLTPSTIPKIFPNVRLIGTQPFETRLRSSAVHTTSSRRLHELEQQYWGSYEPVRNNHGEVGSRETAELIARVTRHFDAPPVGS